MVYKDTDHNNCAQKVKMFFLYYTITISIEMLWANDWYWVGLLEIDNFD